MICLLHHNCQLFLIFGTCQIIIIGINYFFKQLDYLIIQFEIMMCINWKVYTYLKHFKYYCYSNIVIINLVKSINLKRN